MKQQHRGQEASLTLLPAYTGVHTLQEAVDHIHSRRLLWLEILFNEKLDLAGYREQPVVEEAYQKACRWYTTYRSLIETVFPRAPLPSDAGPIDQRDYRTFIEALRFVGTHH